MAILLDVLDVCHRGKAERDYFNSLMLSTIIFPSFIDSKTILDILSYWDLKNNRRFLAPIDNTYNVHKLIVNTSKIEVD